MGGTRKIRVGRRKQEQKTERKTGEKEEIFVLRFKQCCRLASVLALISFSEHGGEGRQGKAETK